jgi:stearoyl-CoA desaturase (delta-9 desaturase)
MGEGWHNNHHFCMTSCRQGIKWWEIDVTYYLLKLLSALGIARDLRGFRLPAN